MESHLAPTSNTFAAQLALLLDLNMLSLATAVVVSGIRPRTYHVHLLSALAAVVIVAPQLP